MTESTARVMLWVAVVSAILGYIAAIAIALSGDRGAAVYYLVVALLVTALAFVGGTIEAAGEEDRKSVV